LQTLNPDYSARDDTAPARADLPPGPRTPISTALTMAALAAAYVVAGKLGLEFASVNPSSTPLWAPTGIALGAMLLFGYRVWPAIFVGAFVVNITTSGSAAVALGIAAGNTMEAIAGAYLVERFGGGRKVFERAQDIFKFAIMAGLISTTVSATVGVTSLALGGYARWADYGAIWVTWWLGDASGDLLIAPLMVLWGERPRIRFEWGRMPEIVPLALTTVGIGLAVFGGMLPPGMRNYPLECLCLPILVWPAFRFGARATASVAALLAVIAAWGTLRGFGPFALATPNESLLLLQTFMATIAMMSVPVATLVWERKRAESDAVEARTVAESANRAKDEFLGILGHELRNPLGAIAAAVYVLEHSGADELRETRARGIITRQIARLIRMVDELLDVTRLSTGRIAMRREAVNLAESVAEAVAAAEIQHDGPELSTTTEPLWIQGDPDRIAQIIGNLLSNALRFTPAGGTVRVTLSREGQWAVMKVEDTGAGIAPARLPHVFDLFAGGEKAASSGGLGIGLPLVDRLVKLHGGRVEASSEGSGRGSTFTVHLPLIEEPADASEEPQLQAR
jgi:signal transduction histidine kinase